jgi:NAD(P)-dependent dehydrogenase (short-subunit alcohol dehydrogenase family)
VEPASYEGRIAFVTGAGSGIGKELALALTKRGARVWVTDMRGRAAEAVAAACGPTAKGLKLDVRDATAVREAITRAAEEGGRLDYVFNNAGIGCGGEVQELEVAHFDRIVDVNVRGVVHGVMAAYPIMVRQGSGHIVNVASMAGLTPSPLTVAYAMSKHAVVGLSTSLRLEAEAYGVRVSALCPGPIATPIFASDYMPDLPKPPWMPNLKRFLTTAAGPAYPPDRLAAEALDAIARNVGVIVLPSRARLLWRLARLSPRLAEAATRTALAKERASKRAH